MFHLPVGEATITLQDVQVLFGLNVDGDEVSGTDTARKPHQWLTVCQAMMGFTPELAAIKNGNIYLSYLLKELCRDLRDDASEEECKQRARVYIMHLIGGFLLPNSSSSGVYMYHLFNLQNLESCGELSWGSAVLACLYKRLCKASHYSAKEISGPLVLLQVKIYQLYLKIKINNVFEYSFCM